MTISNADRARILVHALPGVLFPKVVVLHALIRLELIRKEGVKINVLMVIDNGNICDLNHLWFKTDRISYVRFTGL